MAKRFKPAAVDDQKAEIDRQLKTYGKQIAEELAKLPAKLRQESSKLLEDVVAELKHKKQVQLKKELKQGLKQSKPPIINPFYEEKLQKGLRPGDLVAYRSTGYKIGIVFRTFESSRLCDLGMVHVWFGDKTRVNGVCVPKVDEMLEEKLVGPLSIDAVALEPHGLTK